MTVFLLLFFLIPTALVRLSYGVRLQFLRKALDLFYLATRSLQPVLYHKR